MQSIVEDVHIKRDEFYPLYKNREKGGFAYKTMTVIDNIGNIRFGLKFLQTDEIFCYLPLKTLLKDDFNCNFQYLFLPLKITDNFIV